MKPFFSLSPAPQRTVAMTLACLLSLTGCHTATPTAIESDYRLFVPIDPLTMNFYHDLNLHPMAEEIASATGLVIDYESPLSGQEDLTFLLALVAQETADFMRYDLNQYYRGGVEGAIADGMIHDVTTLVEEHCPHFMAYMTAIPDYERLFYTDEGTLAYFGVTMVEEPLQDLPFYGPMVNQSYLDQVGMDAPQTIAQWEEMLYGFRDMGIVPFAFGAETGLGGLWDAFASAYGVTLSQSFFQEDGVVKFSPLEEGYLDFLTLFHHWYNEGLLHRDFFQLGHEDRVKSLFQTGTVGASVFHSDVLTSATFISPEGMDFAPLPYPVLEEGDIPWVGHTTAVFSNAPIFIHSRVENPIPLLEWVDFFYSPEGIALTNWGIEGETFYNTDEGDRGLTAYITENPDYPPVSMMKKEALTELSLVQEWEREALFFQENNIIAWEVWGKNQNKYHLPATLSYSIAERDIFSMEVEQMEGYIYTSVIQFITGELPLSQFPQFQQTLLDWGAEEYTQIHQMALERYLSR